MLVIENENVTAFSTLNSFKTLFKITLELYDIKSAFSHILSIVQKIIIFIFMKKNKIKKLNFMNFN